MLEHEQISDIIANQGSIKHLMGEIKKPGN